MSTLLYIFIFMTIQLRCTIADLPLKCFLQNYPFSNIFSKDSIPPSFYKISSLQLDPIKVDFIKISEDDFTIETKDIEYIGLNNAILDEYSLNINTSLSRLKFHLDLLAKGLYNIKGNVFSTPISGDGIAIASIKNVVVEMMMPINLIQNEKGEYLVDLQTFYYWEEIIGGAEFSFSNLYNGDKEKSRMMHYLINQNWKMYTRRYGKPYWDELARHLFNTLKKHLLSMPLKDFSKC